MRRFVVLVGLAFIFMAAVSQAENLKIAALDREPYVGQTLTNYGFDSEIITEAFKRAGHQVTIEFTSGLQTHAVRVSVWRPRSRVFPMEISGSFWLDAVSLRPEHLS